MANSFDNSDLDTLAGAVAAPYGPLTRVGDSEAATFPIPGDSVRLEYTSALGVTVYLSFIQLSNSDVTLRLLQQAHPMTYRGEQLKAQVAAARAITNAFSAPHDYADLKGVWDEVSAIEMTTAHY